MCVWRATYVYTHQRSVLITLLSHTSPFFFFFWNWVCYWPWNSLGQRDWLAAELQRSSSLYLPALGLKIPTIKAGFHLFSGNLNFPSYWDGLNENVSHKHRVSVHRLLAPLVEVTETWRSWALWKKPALGLACESTALHCFQFALSASGHISRCRFSVSCSGHHVYLLSCFPTNMGPYVSGTVSPNTFFVS